MIKFQTIQIEKKQLVSITCDRCKKEYDDCMETQEFLLYSNDAGYGSVMGDGNKLRMELCQYCVREVLGPYIRVTGNYISYGDFDQDLSFTEIQDSPNDYKLPNHE